MARVRVLFVNGICWGCSSLMAYVRVLFVNGICWGAVR